MAQKDGQCVSSRDSALLHRRLLLFLLSSSSLFPLSLVFMSPPHLLVSLLVVVACCRFQDRVKDSPVIKRTLDDFKHVAWIFLPPFLSLLNLLMTNTFNDPLDVISLDLFLQDLKARPGFELQQLVFKGYTFHFPFDPEMRCCSEIPADTPAMIFRWRGECISSYHVSKSSDLLDLLNDHTKQSEEWKSELSVQSDADSQKEKKKRREKSIKHVRAVSHSVSARKVAVNIRL